MELCPGCLACACGCGCINWPRSGGLCYAKTAMTKPPKKLSFAEEMELLKKQKAQEAEQAKAAAAQRRLDIAANQQLRATAAAVAAKADANTDENAVANQNASDVQARLDAALAAVMLAGPTVTLQTLPPLRPTPGLAGTTGAPALTTPVLLEDERQQKIKAMDAAFAKIVGGDEPRNKKKEKTKSAMLFCTSCRSTTPGEHVKPGNAGIGLALGLIGFIPGVAYFLYRQMGSEQQCTHCHATTLVGMNSVQARTLCGDQHAALMAAGWPEMRRAELNNTRNRRMAMAKIMVVGVVVLGASLYVLRAPSSPLHGVVDHELRQKAQATEMLERQNSAEGVE